MEREYDEVFFFCIPFVLAMLFQNFGAFALILQNPLHNQKVPVVIEAKTVSDLNHIQNCAVSVIQAGF